MPDVSGVASRDYWVELKVLRTKHKVNGPDVLCEPLQKVWHRKRTELGSTVFVLIRHHDTLRLYQAIPDMQDNFACKYVLIYEDSKPWNWGQLHETLTLRLRN